MVHKRFFACFVLVLAVLCALSVPGYAEESPFPEFTILDPNVSFWTTIYARYTTTQAVVHDNLKLDIVYDVIDLVPKGTPGARETNRARMKKASKTYTGILKRLAEDPSCQDADCLRVAALFGEEADAQTFLKAGRRVRLQLGQKNRFQEGLVRSGAYIDRIRAILLSQGLPEDLAYLPHVESSFDINAYSKSGAAGMWQFTRSTGRRFMTVDHLLDERLDPIAATYAAADLLKDNYEKLGTWPLAITAYNHGAAGMQRAKDVHGDYPSIFKAYKSRSFKFASRNFYSEFLAARKVAMNYRQYFGELELAAPVSHASVCLDGFVAIDELCRHLGVEETKLRALNPALRGPVLNGQKRIPKDYRLNLPGTAAFSEDNCLAGMLSDIYHDKQKPSLFYRVQRGDTAGKVARMHNVSLNDLVLANNLDGRATVYVRQRLRIPQVKKPVLAQKEPLPEGAEKRADKSTVLKKLPQPDQAIVSASLPVAGEMGVSRRPGPTPAERIEETIVAIRQPEPEPVPLAKPLVASAQPAADENAFAFARVEKGVKKPVGTLHVRVKETIGHYAEWAGVRASQIRRLNGIPFGRPLKLHQKVRIPLGRVSADLFESRRLSFHETLQKEFFAAFKVEETQRYRVQPGDSYWSLCHKKFKLPVWLLQQYNRGVDLATLQANQSLIIPAVQSIQRDQTTAPDA